MICMSCAVSFVSAVSPVLGSSMTVAILCASAWRMSVGLFVFVASVIGVGLLGSYTVIVVFVWVVMFLLYAVVHVTCGGVFHRVIHRFGSFPHDDAHIMIWVTGVIHRVFHKQGGMGRPSGCSRPDGGGGVAPLT